VGHVFQLGQKYAEAMQATVLDDQQKAVVMWMGCYGIGVSRIVASAIEQNHDDAGIIWPESIAPFQVVLLPMNPQASEAVQTATDLLYQQLTKAGIDVLLDDRGLRAGVMFNDADLIGIPHRVVIGDKGLAAGQFEYRHRRASQAENIPCDGFAEWLIARVRQSNDSGMV